MPAAAPGKLPQLPFLGYIHQEKIHFYQKMIDLLQNLEDNMHNI